MRVPLEILRLILRDMVKVLPARELVRARLVNSLFASEILPLIHTSPRLEDEDFVYCHWAKFPYKRAFLHHKIHTHDGYPCIFSSWVHEVLQLPCNATQSHNERDELIDKLIDAFLYTRHWPSELFSTQRLASGAVHIYSSLRRHEHEPIEETLRTALLSSAIIRHNVPELIRLLDAHPRGISAMTMPSNRLRIVPIDIAAKVGSEELVSLLVERNCKLNYWDGVSWGWHRTNALSVAARAGNRGALEAWIKYSTALPTNRITSSGHNRDIQPTLVRAFRAAVRVGKIEIAEFLERHGVNSNPEPEGEGELETKWFELMLCDAVELGNIKIVRRCLGRQDAHVFGSGWTNRYGRRKWAKLKGPLWIALQDCPRHERPDIVRLLLEAGFDAHDHRPETNKTLLQCAVKDGDVESARLLVEHGADIDVCGSGGPGDRHQAPLSLAVNAARTKNSNGNMVRMLLDNRAKRRWFWRGKEYVLEADAGKVVSIERIFKDLGFDEEDMENAFTDFYVVVNHVL